MQMFTMIRDNVLETGKGTSAPSDYSVAPKYHKLWFKNPTLNEVYNWRCIVVGKFRLGS